MKISLIVSILHILMPGVKKSMEIYHLAISVLKQRIFRRLHTAYQWSEKYKIWNSVRSWAILGRNRYFDLEIKNIFFSNVRVLYQCGPLYLFVLHYMQAGSIFSKCGFATQWIRKKVRKTIFTIDDKNKLKNKKSLLTGVLDPNPDRGLRIQK